MYFEDVRGKFSFHGMGVPKTNLQFFFFTGKTKNDANWRPLLFAFKAK